MSNSSRLRRTKPASLPKSPTVKMRLELLEDRVVPSTSIPLTGVGFRDIGPAPIAPTAQSPDTLAPGNLSQGGRVVDVAVDPTNRNIYYANTAEGGVVKSLDGGITWNTPTLLENDDPATPAFDPKFIYSTLTDNLPASTPVTQNGVQIGTLTEAQRQRILKGGAITIDPRNTNNIYAGLGNLNTQGFGFAGEGLLISNNGGVTWRLEIGPTTPVGNPNFVGASFQDMFFVTDPTTNAQFMFITVSRGAIYGENSYNAVYRSADSGVTFEEITRNINQVVDGNFNSFQTFSDFSVDPTNPRVGYLSTTNGGVIRSQSILNANPTVTINDWAVLLGGSGTFVPGNTLGTIKAQPVPQNPSTVYVGATGANGFLLYRTRNSGTDIVEVLGVNIPGPYSSFDMIIDPTTGTGTTRIYLSGRAGVIVIDINEASNSPVVGTSAFIQNISRDGSGEGPFNNIYRMTFDRILAPGMAFGDTRLIVSTDGGVYRLNTPTPFPQVPQPVRDWESINGTPGPRALNAQAYFGGGLPARDNNRYFGGTFNNGSPLFTDPGGIPAPSLASLYSQPITAAIGNNLIAGAGDVFWDFRDVDANGNANTLYQATRDGSARLIKSVDGGLTWTNISNGIGFAGNVGGSTGSYTNVDPAFILDPSIPFNGANNSFVRLLYGTRVVNESLQSGNNGFSQFGVDLPYVTDTGGFGGNGAVHITELGVSRENRNIIYASLNARRNAPNNGLVEGALYALRGGNFTLNDILFSGWRDVTPYVTPTPDGTLGGYVLVRAPGSGVQPPRNDLFGALGAQITDIENDPSSEQRLYLTTSSTFVSNGSFPNVDGSGPIPAGQAVGKVFFSFNGGRSWTDLTRNLPSNYVVFSAALDPNRFNGQTTDDLYVGTDVGVWKLSNPTNPASMWVRVGLAGMSPAGIAAALPDVQVRDVDINTTTGTLSAATFGRGVWQIQIRPFVSGFVFNDVNGNGAFDLNTTETGLAGITNTVIDISQTPNVQFASSITAADGSFIYNSLPDGTYQIRTSNASSPIIDNSINPVTGTPFAFQLTTAPQVFAVNNIPVSETINGLLIGLFQRFSISGVKFNDINSNGVRDAGEPGIGGVQIDLLRGDNLAPLASFVTLADGSYSFTGLGAITGGVAYLLREAVPPNSVPTSPVGGELFVLPISGLSRSIDFGNFKFITISGVKFDDLNGNGIYDIGVEPTLPGFTINASLNGTVVASAVTDANGFYSFGGLGNGTYILTEVQQPGFGQTTFNPAPIVAQSGDVISNVNFGNFRDINIGGNVFNDFDGDGIQQTTEGGPLAGLTIGLFDSTNLSAPILTTTTDAAGNYFFNGLKANRANTTYQVAIISSTVVQTEANPVIALNASGVSQGVAPLAGFIRTTLQGFAFEDINGDGVRQADEPPLVNATLSVRNLTTGVIVATVTTDAGGNYIVGGLPLTDKQPVGRYDIVTGAGVFVTTPAMAPIQLFSGVPAVATDIGIFRQALLLGIKYNDLNGDGVLGAGEPGVSGVTFNVINAATGTLVGSTVSDSVGRFTFIVGPGTYFVREVAPAGSVQTSADPAAFRPLSGSVNTGFDFGNFNLFNLSGQTFNDINGDSILSPGEPLLAGFNVQLTNLNTGVVANTTSDGAGNYIFTNLGPGQYQVQELPPPGWIVTTANPVVFNASSGTPQAVSFGNFFIAAITGNVFEDLNRDAMPSAGEPGTGGITVQLLQNGAIVATTQSDAAGNYTFTGLTNSTFQVQIVPPVGFIVTTPLAGAIQTTSNGTAVIPPIGVLRLGEVSGNIFLDGNRNRSQDPFERGLPGLQLGAFLNGTTLAGSATSDSAGNYRIFGLEAGAYVVRIINLPVGFTVTSPQPDKAYTVAVGIGSNNPAVSVGGLNFGAVGSRRYAVGAAAGGGPRVQVYDSQTGTLLQDFFVYEESFIGGVRVATGDVNGDGVDDLAVVPGKGGGPRIRVFDGVTGAELYNFFAYEPSFRDGLFIALGDVDGDGFADMISGTDSGGGPRVTVYSGKTGANLADYFAYDPAFRGGVRVGAGDVNNDGLADVITVPGIGGGPQVIAWSGLPLTQINSFLAFDERYRGGAYVTAGGIQPNGFADIVVGPGAATDFYPGDRVRFFDGIRPALIRDVPAFTLPNQPVYNGEVRVSSIDRNDDSFSDVGIATGPGTIGRFRFLDGRNGRPLGDTIQPFESTFLGGVFIG